MCRLFGFRSVISSQVHSSLVSADNALMRQSERHPDGWGVAYYISTAPHIIKSSASAVEDHLFHKVSGIVTSQTVLAHLRKATVGNLSTINTHPFQFGHWVFAHNGNIKNFPEHREKLNERIAPKLRRFILGDTDSETIFYLALTHLERRVELHRADCDINDLISAVKDAVDEITDIVGPYFPDDNGAPEETFLTFILTNGQSMVAHQGGKDLYYSTYKKRCSERDTCPYFAKQCEEEAHNKGYVNHLLFSSEPLSGENIWDKMNNGDVIGIDWRMKIQKSV